MIGTPGEHDYPRQEQLLTAPADVLRTRERVANYDTVLARVTFFSRGAHLHPSTDV